MNRRVLAIALTITACAWMFWSQHQLGRAQDRQAAALAEVARTQRTPVTVRAITRKLDDRRLRDLVRRSIAETSTTDRVPTADDGDPDTYQDPYRDNVAAGDNDDTKQRRTEAVIRASRKVDAVIDSGHLSVAHAREIRDDLARLDGGTHMRLLRRIIVAVNGGSVELDAAALREL